MIEKPTIIITSTGRTGTKFFANLFSTLYPTCTALHEPDILTIGKQSSLGSQIKEIGIGFFIKKVFGRWSIVGISDALFTGSISKKEAIHKFIKQRKDFIVSRQGKVYFESSLSYYGLIDILDQVFKNYRAVYLIRDGREWVRSFMDRGLNKRNPTYDKSFIMGSITHSWPDATQLEKDPYKNQWGKMDRFERLCWAWSTLNSHAIQAVDRNPYCKLVKFEDIFTSENGVDSLIEIIEFIGEINDMNSVTKEELHSLLHVQPNVSMNKFPSWDEWSDKRKDFFSGTCMPLMKKLDYQIK